MLISEIITTLENLAPLSSQESYDNAGLIVGDKTNKLTNALISLDCTVEIIDEAIRKGCNLVISHHPIVFKGLKKITGKNYVEQTLIKAIKNDIAIYAIHTNLDSYKLGVNKKIADLIGVNNPRILMPAKESLVKLSVFVPHLQSENLRKVLFNSGAGSVGEYDECSFSYEGTGTFRAGENSNPYVGEKGIRHEEKEVKIEVIVTKHNLNKVVSEMLKAHPYEEVAYDCIPLLNENNEEGAGMIGTLETPMEETEFLAKIKSIFKCGIVRHTALKGKSINKVAWCGGSGSFLLNHAKRKNADIFITGDFKYHEFFDAENQIIIADIGHYESEQYTIELISELLQKKIPTFAPLLTDINTNPVKYF